MTVVITDLTGRTIQPAELEQLALWNETVSHICATALARIPQEEAETVPCVI